MSDSCLMLDRLHPPSAEMIIRVQTRWEHRPSSRLTAWLQSLEGCVPYGMHGLGWYVYWMMNNYTLMGTDLIRFRKNWLKGEWARRQFSRGLNPAVVESYKMQISHPGRLPELDSRPVLVYDHLVRSGRASEASEWLAGSCTRAVAEFLGLPFVRCALSAETEAELWTLAKCPCAPFSRRQGGRPEYPT